MMNKQEGNDVINLHGLVYGSYLWEWMKIGWVVELYGKDWK